MARKRACRKCGAELAGGRLEGLCPICVAQVVFVLEPEHKAAELKDLPAIRQRFFGDYELVEEIARGGMGVVYKARQLSLNRVVAVKMILTGQLASPSDIQRFRAEAEAAANLLHPNIVAIHEVGQHDGQHYFSMDYVEGKNLAQVREKRGESNAEWFGRVANWMKTLAEAIHYAHEQGTLHRDLKPSNILIDASDQPHITDFGLAKQVKHDSDLTITGQVIGTPNFMPPEQAAARRGQIGPPSDIYSLGAILYFLLTGQPPFTGVTTHETLTKVLGEEPRLPQELKPGVPRDLATICLKCLQKDPRRRYCSGKALAEDLERFLDDEPILARAVGRPERLWRLCRRHPAAAGLAGLLVVLAGLGLGRSLMPRVIPSFPVKIGIGVSGVIDGKLYATAALEGYSGLHNYIYVYDPALNTWETLPNTPLPPGHCAAGVVGRKFYLAGGPDWKNNETNALLVFDPASNLWTNGRPMPSARLDCIGAVWNGKLFVMGGATGGDPLPTAEVYDPATDTWATLAPMHTPRASPRAATIGSKIYVVGGNTARNAPATNSIEVYDCVTGQWSFSKPLAVARSSAFVFAYNGALFVAGGKPLEKDESDTVEAYHPETDTWITLSPMPMPSREGAGAQVMNGRIWLLGGWTYGNDKVTGEPIVAYNEVFIYNPSRDSWSISGRKRQAN